jgi:hypothetical protein
MIDDQAIDVVIDDRSIGDLIEASGRRNCDRIAGGASQELQGERRAIVAFVESLSNVQVMAQSSGRPGHCSFWSDDTRGTPGTGRGLC